MDDEWTEYGYGMTREDWDRESFVELLLTHGHVIFEASDGFQYAIGTQRDLLLVEARAEIIE